MTIRSLGKNYDSISPMQRYIKRLVGHNFITLFMDNKCKQKKVCKVSMADKILEDKSVLYVSGAK